MTEEAQLLARPPWWREHLLWVLGGVPVGVALLRVLVAARFSPESAAAIVAASAPLEVLAGLFFSTVLHSAPYLAVLLWLAIPAANGTSAEDLVQVSAGCFAVLAVLVTPSLTLAILIGFPVLAGAAAYWRERVKTPRMEVEPRPTESSRPVRLRVVVRHAHAHIRHDVAAPRDRKPRTR